MISKRQTLVVPEKYYEPLGHLASLGVVGVDWLGSFSANEAITLDADGLARKISAAVKIPANVSGAIIGLLMSLNDLRSERKQDPESLVRDLTAAITEQATADWKKEHLGGWSIISEKLPPLLRPNGFFSLFRKAYEIALNRASVALSLQILSDIRPLYDEDADTIQAIVLSHTLALRIQEGPEIRVLHITLDAGDMRKLSAELDRAAKKEATLVRRASDWGVPLLQLDSGS